MQEIISSHFSLPSSFNQALHYAIAFFETPASEEEELRQAFSGKDLLFFTYPLSEKNAEEVQDCEILSVFIHSEVNKAVIDKMPRLKLIDALDRL